MRNDQVAAHWARQDKPQLEGSSMGFRGPKLYSYGTLVARLVTNARGERAAFITSQGYSSSTSAHVNLSRAAAKAEGWPIMRLPWPGRDGADADNLKWLEMQASDFERHSARAKTQDKAASFLREAERVRAEAAAYLAFWNEEPKA